MAKVKATLVCAGLFLCSTVLAIVEELDDTFKDTRVDDVWLVDFYAPWCGYCKKLEPVWYDVGVELKSSGSPVRVGKMDGTAYSGMSSEFGVRGYPTIKLLKGDLAYNYKGPRTKDDIVEFANRVAGPAVRALPSKQMFDHMMKRHDVLFVYFGGESPLKEKYIDMAAELIVYTYFFSASEDVLPESVTLPELPSVVVFKDGAYFTYDDWGSIPAPTLQSISFTCLYLNPSAAKMIAVERLQSSFIEIDILLHSLSSELVICHISVTFFRMIISSSSFSLPHSEVSVPSIIILNTSNEQYFLPSEPVETLEQLVHFINSVLDGSAQAQGGDGMFQRVKRVAFDAKSTIMSVFRSSPVLGCFLFGLPLGVISLMCYGICTAESDDGQEDMELMKREDDEEEDEEEDEPRQASGELEGPEEDGENEEEEEQEEKNPVDKKAD
uniref:protein disulfide-isomerase n=1 Tax=Salmo trutta TaxID=8032 RepID=A0A674AE77_SALTR